LIVSATPPARSSRVALITGGTGGLGQAVVAAFLDAGANVVTTYVLEEEAARVRAALGDAGGRLVLESADVTDAAAVNALVERTTARWGGVDYLLNLVGGFAGGAPLWEVDEAALTRTFDLNLRSALTCCRAVLPGMVARNFGRIVNVSSRSAVRPTPGVAAYAVSKATIISLTEALAEDVRPYDVNVNCVLPSVIDTPANRRDMPDADVSQWVSPEQLARIMVWLTSPDAAPINGAALPVYARA
jgi:NAD(P)-dependent dehydrogenase (short-subunit alcohol dehydrogenase family)